MNFYHWHPSVNPYSHTVIKKFKTGKALCNHVKSWSGTVSIAHNCNFPTKYVYYMIYIYTHTNSGAHKLIFSDIHCHYLTLGDVSHWSCSGPLKIKSLFLIFLGPPSRLKGM